MLALTSITLPSFALSPAAVARRSSTLLQHHARLPPPCAALPPLAPRWRSPPSPRHAPPRAQLPRLPAAVEPLVGPLVFFLLLSSGALGLLFQAANVIFLVIFLVPLIGGPIFQWYINQNLLEGTCPDCGAPIQVLKDQSARCMSCGSSVASELDASGVFMRVPGAASGGDDGLVDVEVLSKDD